MSAERLLQLCLDKLQFLFTRLPDKLQEALRIPYIQKGIAILVTLRLLKGFNGWLSQCVQNNWLRSHTWNPSAELVVLTGGCGGIGRQVMQDLAQLRVKTIILDIQKPNFPLPPSVFFYAADIASSSAVTEVAIKIRKEHGHPTILINNAGVGVGGTILDESEEKIRLTMEVNTLSHFWTVKEFLPSTIKNDHGHIITVASMASFVTFGESVDYSCSKAGVLAFHEGLAQEIRHWYGSKRVRTSIIHPLWVRTPMIDHLIKAGKHLPQRIMNPEDVSGAVVKQVISGNSGQVTVPDSYGVASIVRGRPNWMQERVRDRTSKDFIRLRRLDSEVGGSSH